MLELLARRSLLIQENFVKELTGLKTILKVEQI